ncbi:hypothetical protein SOVF_091450 [Spinacia oleracea]|nr:hypothetical protein SOVF_091450 [Spinacia oleracea]
MVIRPPNPDPQARSTAAEPSHRGRLFAGKRNRAALQRAVEGRGRGGASD